MTTRIFASEGRKSMATNCPVYGHWYSHFMYGVHNHMRGDICPDMAILIEVFHAIMKYVYCQRETRTECKDKKQWQSWDSFLLQDFQQRSVEKRSSNWMSGN